MELKEFVLWHKAEEAPKDILKDIYEVDQFGIIRYAATPISCTHGDLEENWHYYCTEVSDVRLWAYKEDIDKVLHINN